MKKTNKKKFVQFLNQFMQGVKTHCATAGQITSNCNANKLLKQRPLNALKTHGSYQHKQIHSAFRANVSDQKRRAQFAKRELQKIVLQTVTTVDRRVCALVNVQGCNKAPRAFAQAKVKSIQVYNGPKISPTVPFSKLSCFELSSHKALGPTLRLEKPVNQKFAFKKGSFSTIRNRCILTGRSTIVGKFRLSRIRFRHLAHLAMLGAVTKCVNR